MNTTKEQIKAALDVTLVMAETIRELKEVPNGHLYAQVMGQISLASYEKVIETLKRAGLVKEKGNLLTWIGPDPAL